MVESPRHHLTEHATQSSRLCRLRRLDWQQVHAAFRLPELALLIEDLMGLFGGDERAFTPWRLFDWEANDEAPFACMLEPPSLDARIVVQAAVFTICSSKTQSFDAFLEAHDLAGALTKFVIPLDHVPRLRDQLDLVGIDERRIFPDLDGVAAHLRRYYS